MANKNNNKSIDVSYVFPETISKKSGDLYSKVPGIDELTIYEEPRWSFKDHLNNEVMNYLKENDNDLYEEIIEYQKEHPDGFYFDVGKSLRYDDLLFWWQGGDCSLETLEDKLDDLFIVRYSAEGLDGNLDNPDEIHISDEKLVSKLNSMIKEHVQNNIDRYNEYKKIRSELVDKELADKHNNALDVYYEEDLKAYTDYAPLPEKTNPENQIIRVQEGQLTTELEVLLDLNKEGDLTHNFGWFKYAELDKNGVLVKDYPVGIWDQRQDEKGNPLNPPKIDTKDISQVIFSKELREKIDSNLKEKIDEVSQTLMRENFENNIHNGKFTDFNAEKVVESMKNKTFKEFEAIGSFEAGNCSFNLWITKGGVPEEPWIDISPVRTIGGTDINGTVSLSLSDIMEPTETLSVEEQIKNTILRKIDELDSPEDTQKTILTVLGKNYDELNKNKNWVWKDYDDLSGHLESPDGKSYFSYDWTTKEYKTTPESSWDSFIDADPTRDTSLSAFKKYAEKFVRNNIAKDNDIVFERKYIDTSKEMEGETMSNETLADKYNRMNKLFEERKSREGSGNPLTFEELYKWTEEEFPEKDSSEVLRETVGRMIMDNVSHEDFNVEYYDDVYGFGDGADFRWDLSFKAADALLSGDALTFSEAQELIYKESNKMFEELKQNPNYKNEIELTDRINAAFRISKNLYPDFAKLYEHDVPEDGFYNYTKADKKAYIEKAWETIQKEYGNTLAHHRVADLRTDGIDLESEYRKVTGEILTADLVSLIKGHDVVLYGEESLNFIRPNKENIELAFENNWSEFDAITKGYSLASSSSIKDAVNIEKIDDMDVFDSDVAAAKQYGIDHNVPIFEEKQTIWIGDDNNEYYSYPDTPENRKVLKDYLIDKPVKEKFDWSEFTEKDFDLLKRNLDNSTERMYGSVHIGSISCDLQYREGNKFDLDFYVLGDEGYGGEIEFDEIGIPYSENAITSLNLDEIKDMSYDQFKDWYQDILIKNIEEENYTYEARRPTVNWSNEEQCRELYRTKLIESAKLNEIVIAPYTHDEEHQRAVEIIRQWLSDASKLPVKSISDEMVFAVIDNIGVEQGHEPGDFLKVLKDGTIEHISAAGEIEKEPVEILSIINNFAENHAAVSEEGSEQRKDYEYVNFLYNTVFKNYLNRDDRSSYSEAENIIKEQLEKLSGIKVDDNIADEIYFRYKEHELIVQPIQYLDSYKFRIHDKVDNKYLNPVSAAELLEQTLAWNEKELSELHSGTADDEMIKKIKNINDELEHIREQITTNGLKVFEGSKISLNYDGKNIQGKIMLSDGDSVEIEPFEISESELNDCWYGFKYKGKDFDMNVCLNDAENEGTPVCIYPVINGTTITTSDFAAIKKDSVFFEKQIAKEIINNNQMENKTMFESMQNLYNKSNLFYTWDDLYILAEKENYLSAKDAAREQIGKAAKKFGIDIEGSEIPEDAIDDFLEKHPELNRFNESGQMLAEIDSENEILNKPFIPSEYVLNKLQEKGIEVVTDKSKFNELLKASEILQKMEGNKKENLSDKYFQANQSEAEAFSKELDAFIADYDKTQKTINPLKMLNVGSITPVMKLLGIADVPVGIDQSTILKALREEPIYPDDEQGHKLTIDELKNIPQSLADPVMVFRSDSPTRRQRDSYVFFTEQRDFKNRSIIIPVAVNKKYGRLVINKVTSIYGRNEEIRYVKDNIQRGNLVYFDKKRSLEWERECKVQFLAQVLPIEGSINNILSKDSLVKFLDSKSEKMVKDGTTYGFAHNGKIYLNSDVLSAEAAMHEYTHLWDNLTRKDNPMLWNKGLEIFKSTSIWNEVINDEHYQDIKDDENLVLSECHARITGKVAESVLNRIAELDGNEKQAEMIDWDKETVEFIFENYRDIFEKNSFSSVAKFTTATMKDLFSPVEQQITSLDFNSKEHAQKVKEMLGKDFIITDVEAKVLLSYATHFDDGTHEYGLNKDGQLYFKTNQDREGWSFCTEESMQCEFLTSAFDGAAILLDSDRKNDADLLNCFLYNNRTLLSVLDDNMSYKSSLKDIKE